MIRHWRCGSPRAAALLVLALLAVTAVPALCDDGMRCQPGEELPPGKICCQLETTSKMRPGGPEVDTVKYRMASPGDCGEMGVASANELKRVVVVEMRDANGVMKRVHVKPGDTVGSLRHRMAEAYQAQVDSIRVLRDGKNVAGRPASSKLYKHRRFMADFYPSGDVPSIYVHDKFYEDEAERNTPYTGANTYKNIRVGRANDKYLVDDDVHLSQLSDWHSTDASYSDSSLSDTGPLLDADRKPLMPRPRRQRRVRVLGGLGAILGHNVDEPKLVGVLESERGNRLIESPNTGAVFRAERFLKAGEEGYVYKAVVVYSGTSELVTGTTVALKLSHTDPQSLKRPRLFFKQAFDKANAIESDPSIMKIYDYFQEEVAATSTTVVKRPVLVLQFVNGPDFQDWLADNPASPNVAQFKRFMLQLLRACIKAVDADYTLFDVQPQNAMLDLEEDRLVLIDLNIQPVGPRFTVQRMGVSIANDFVRYMARLTGRTMGIFEAEWPLNATPQTDEPAHVTERKEAVQAMIEQLKAGDFRAALATCEGLTVPGALPDVMGSLERPDDPASIAEESSQISGEDTVQNS